MSSIHIDTAFDFRQDTPDGGDPDSLSPTLRRYHRQLWTKHLPNGTLFELDDTTQGAYLHHSSALGEFYLASDTVIPSFDTESCLAEILAQVPSEHLETFNRATYTMGGMMLFPANRVDRKMTINGARGLHPRIKDRFDLTVECIRRHYQDEPSPLADTLARYASFFALFGCFADYIKFFLLQDIVTADFSSIRFSTPFDDFKTKPIPQSVDAYLSYLKDAHAFVTARNERILGSCQQSAS